MRYGLAVFLLAALPAGGAGFRDIDGIERALPTAPGSKATAVYFVTHDCPISNRYAPEIRRICDEYAAAGLRCVMAYVDPTLDEARIRRHRQEYGGGPPAVLDRNHELVALAGATVTPEAAVFDASGELAYLGRIDNLYASLGTPRRQPTQRDLRDALDEVLAGKPASRARTKAVGCFIPSLDLVKQGTSK